MARFLEGGPPFVSRRLLGSRPPPGRAWQRHRHPAGKSLFLWGWVAAKPTPAASLLPFRRRSWLLLARKSWVRWRERPAGSRQVKNQANGGTRTAVVKKKLMKNKNLKEEPAPANADQLSSNVRPVAASSPEALQKAAAILLLAEFRRQWRALAEQRANPNVLAGFKCGALIAFQHIERETPEWELWTALPDEALTGSSPES